MQETWVQSLSWEDPLEKGKAMMNVLSSNRVKKQNIKLLTLNDCTIALLLKKENSFLGVLSRSDLLGNPY